MQWPGFKWPHCWSFADVYFSDASYFTGMHMFKLFIFCTNYLISGCEFTSSLASWLQTFVWDVHLFSFLFLLWVFADYRDMYQTCFSSQLSFGDYNFQFPCWWITLLTVLITSGQRNWRWLVHADGMISNQGQLCIPYLKFLRVSAWSCELFKCVPCLKNSKSFSIIGWSRCLPCRSWAFQDLSSG